MRNPGVSVVVLSAAMGPGDLDRAVEAGADAVLDKVGSPPTIAQVVRRLAAGGWATLEHERLRAPTSENAVKANFGERPFLALR